MRWSAPRRTVQSARVRRQLLEAAVDGPFSPPSRFLSVEVAIERTRARTARRYAMEVERIHPVEDVSDDPRHDGRSVTPRRAVETASSAPPGPGRRARGA
jgi:hypothetical protein